MHGNPGSHGRQALIGIDVGGTNLRFALVREDGAIIERRRAATCCTTPLFLQQLSEGIDSLAGLAGSAGCHIAGVGVGMPGLISPSGYVHSSVNLPHCEGMNLSSEIASLTGLPVTVGNDANASAAGEHCFGAGRGFPSFLMITLGTGVGGGLVLAGRLWTGSDGFAGEFGHITVEHDGHLCPCGNRGCVEQYASASAIVSAARKEGRWSSCQLTAETLAAAALAGDRHAASLFERAGRALGIAAADVVNLLNLDAVILGGGVSASYPLLSGPMDSEMRSRAFGPSVQRVTIVKGELGDDAGVLGAAALLLAG